MGVPGTTPKSKGSAKGLIVGVDAGAGLTIVGDGSLI